MHQMRISTTEVSSVMLRSKKLEIQKKKKEKKMWKLKEPSDVNQNAIKLSQIRRRIELCMREIMLRFEMNLQNLLFPWQFNSYSYLKQVPNYLATGL
jgi:hypothetical protein